MKRARALIKLGHPDLGACDAYKAILLLARMETTISDQVGASRNRRRIDDRYDQRDTEPLLPRMNQQSQDAQLLLAIAVFFCNSFHECLDILGPWDDERAEKLRQVAQQGLDQEREFHLRNGLDPEQAEEELRAGTVRWRVCPWTRKD